MLEHDLTLAEIQAYQVKCASGEATMEDAKRIVAYLREKRGKARPEAVKKKAAPGTAVGPTTDELLEGL